MSDNGRKPMSPFHATTGHVPLVGQPFEIGQCTVTALLVCKCDGSHPLLVMMHGITPCPACGKGYTIKGVTIQDGQPPRFTIGTIMPSPSGETTS